MKKMLIPITLFMFCLSMVMFSGCGSNRRIVENEHLSFTLDNGYDYAFHDVKQDQKLEGFPLGNQLKIVIWNKEYPNNWNIRIYYPCPGNVSDLMVDTSKKTVNGVEILLSEYEGFFLQAYLDPEMILGISSINEMSTEEADKIIESLSIKKSIEK